MREWGAQPDPQAGQAPPQPEQAPPQAGQSADVSDSQLALFVRVSEKVSALQQQIQTEMQEAKTAEEAQIVQAEAQERLVNAVQSLGMTVDEYNELARLVQTDPEIQQRINALTQ